MATYLINGATPKILGITDITVEETHLAGGVMMLTVDRAMEAGFNYGDAVTLTRDGVTVFLGKVGSPPDTGSETADSQTVEVRDFWGDLERTMFVQETEDLEEMGVDYAEIQARQWLEFVDGEDSRITGQERLELVLSVAAEAGVAVQAGESLEILTAKYSPNPEPQNRYCSDVIREIMEPFPDVCLWVDYTTTPPTMHARQRGDEAATTTYAIGTPPLAGYEMRPRHDLAPAGVVIKWTRRQSGNVQWEYYPEEGTSPEGLGVLNLSQDYTGVFWPGYAQRWYEALNELIWEGGVTLLAVDCDWGKKPGWAVNLTGAKEAWETAAALVQKVSRDVFSGRTSLNFGMAQHLDETSLGEVRGIHQKRKSTNLPDADESVPAGPALTLRTTKPAWYAGEIEEGTVWVEPGTVNNVVPNYMFAGWALSLGMQIWIKAYLSSGATLKVTAAEIKVGSVVDAQPDWDPGAPRPDYYIIPLGGVSGTGEPYSYGQGSIMIVEYATDINKAAGEVTAVTRALSHHRKA